MKKLYDNRFIFIVSVSIIFIMVLAFGSVALTKHNTKVFENAGYIISNNKVLNFNDGTSYRVNLSEKVVFSTSSGEIYEVDQSSFIHYGDGSIALLKNGAFVDLNSIASSIAPYYNITNKSLVEYKDGGYSIINGKEVLYFEDILLRVSETKYLVAGKNISIKVPGVDGLLSGQYFELEFIADGIILIENEKDSYQVTADGTMIYIGDKTVIDLGTKNVLWDGEVRLSMSQVTIDGNENITITPEKEDKPSNEEPGNNPNPNPGENNNADNGNEEGEGGNEGDQPNEEDKPSVEDDEVSIDLVSLNVGVESVTAVFQVNNPLKLTGTLNIAITNPKTNEIITPTYNMTSTGYLSVYSDNLEANQSYLLTISENRNGDEAQYIQRLFTTDTFGISLKKVMISDTEINYDVLFDDNSKVEEVRLQLFDVNGDLVADSEKIATKESNSVSFINLSSNSTYTLKAVSFKINSVTYLNENGYLTKTVKTLKKKPEIRSVSVSSNEDKTIFTMNIVGIEDPDSSITKYTYYLYKDSDLENPVYQTAITAPLLSLTVGEGVIEANTNYRFKAIIEYNDNEKIREIETGFSSKFISTGAAVSFVLNDSATTFNTLVGDIILKDPDCSVPMPGREACPGPNSFTVSYYSSGVKRYKTVNFEATENEDTFKISNFTLTGLSANTLYTMELNGDVYIEEDGERKLVSQVIIGDPFTAMTKDIDNLKIDKKSDNASSDEYPINFTVSLETNSSNSNFIDQVKTMTVTLYALDASNNKIQIGNVVHLNSSEINSLLYNKEYQMTNKFFGIDNIEELLEVASDETGWAYLNYEVDFTDAYDAPIGEITEESNEIEIENNEVKTSISKAYLLDYYAKQKESTKATVATIYNKDLDTKVENLDGSTIVGYKIDATVYVTDILRQYYGVISGNNDINWDYVFYIFNKDGEIIYTSNKKKTTTHTFYLDDENIPDFDRGDAYYFGFQIVLQDGLYPEEIVIAYDKDGNSIVNPPKENPQIAMGIWESTASSLTFMYKITKDVDDALYGNNIYIYDTNNNLIDTKEITKSDDYQYVTIENLSEESTYVIVYNKVNNALEEGYTSVTKGRFVFEGYFTLNSDFTLNYTESGNSLNIKINDENLLRRSEAFEVNVSSGSIKKHFVLTRRDLKACESEAKNCLIIDYHDLEDLQGLNAKVDVKAYYDNGLIGLNQNSNYYVFKDASNVKYLAVKDNGTVVKDSEYADGLYKFVRTDMSMSITNNIKNREWDSNLQPASFVLAVTNAGITYSNYGTYNPKVIKDVTLSTSDDNFYFSSIIPMVNSSSSSKINSADITLNLSGITSTIVQNEFRDDDEKIYIDLYDNDTFTGTPITKSVTLDKDNLSKTLSYTFTGLKPDMTYYYKIYAYILNNSNEYVKTELYDYRADGVLEHRVKSVKTLGVNEIFESVDAAYSSETTSEKYMTRKIETTVKLLNTDNFKLVYEITDGEGNNVFENAEVSNLATSVVNTYDISDDTFLFGESGYRLKLTAVTKDSNKYELVLYDGEFIPHLKDDSSYKELREPTFRVVNSSVFVPAGESKYSSSFSISVNDPDLVIKSANYYVKFTDDYGNSYTPVGYTLGADGYVKLNAFEEINTRLTYKNLDANSYYSITIKADTFRNNASLADKNETTYGYGYIETGNNYNLEIGEGTLSVDNNILTIDYTGSKNLNNVTKVVATVRKENTLVGNYEFSGSNLNFISEGSAWSLNLNISSSAISLNRDDKVRVIVRYYAKNLTTGTEELVKTATYANYSED